MHVAKERNIQLIIWGQNQAIEQVGKFSHYNNVQMSKWSRLEHDLFNVDCQKLIGNGTEVDVDKLHYYNFGGSYSKGGARLTANYGRQRGGLVCVGGVCRFVPESNGYNLILSYSF